MRSTEDQMSSTEVPVRKISLLVDSSYNDKKVCQYTFKIEEIVGEGCGWDEGPSTSIWF